PGIPAADHQRVFERFYRVDHARASQTGGTGLGLAIARWAVEANGGRIELESFEGRGTIFRAVLPRSCHKRQDLESRWVPRLRTQKGSAMTTRTHAAGALPPKEGA